MASWSVQPGLLSNAYQVKKTGFTERPTMTRPKAKTVNLRIAMFNITLVMSYRAAGRWRQEWDRLEKLQAATMSRPAIAQDGTVS